MMSSVASKHGIVAIRGERGSYNANTISLYQLQIVAIRGERGSYNLSRVGLCFFLIVAIRGERGSYNGFGSGQI